MSFTLDDIVDNGPNEPPLVDPGTGGGIVDDSSPNDSTGYTQNTNDIFERQPDPNAPPQQQTLDQTQQQTHQQATGGGETIPFNWRGQQYNLTQEQINTLAEMGADSLDAQEIARQQPQQQTQQKPEPAVSPDPTPDAVFLGKDKDGKDMWTKDPVAVALHNANKQLTEKINTLVSESQSKADKENIQRGFEDALRSNTDFQDIAPHSQSERLVRVLSMVGAYNNPNATPAQNVAHAVRLIKEFKSSVLNGQAAATAQTAQSTPAQGSAPGVAGSKIPKLTARDMDNGNLERMVTAYLQEVEAASA